jgi:large subunit ribosomal protein L9
MQILLNGDVKKLGHRGDLVVVKPGYFRNFLYPRGLAQVATPKVVKLANERNKKRVMHKESVVENAKDVLKAIKGLTVVLKSKVSDKGKLYGSITETDVADAIKASVKIDLDKGFIKMDHIKEVGDHIVLVNLGEGLEEKVKVRVEAA